VITDTLITNLETLHVWLARSDNMVIPVDFVRHVLLTALCVQARMMPTVCSVTTRHPFYKPHLQSNANRA